MKNKILVFAAIFGALSVVFGAFGAHALKALISEQALANWQTAVNYQFFHSLALLILSNKPESKELNRVSWFFVLGILLFSGSLYALSLREITNLPISFLGPITPIGGLLFIIGWVMLLLSGLRKN